MYKLIGVVFAAALAAASVFSTGSFADDGGKLTQRSDSAGAILMESTNAPDKEIPNSLLRNAVCIAAIPHVVTVAWGAGGLYGRGLVSCRTSAGWSLPSYVFLSGGSFGFQIGLSATDLVLVFVRAAAVDDLSATEFALGGDAGVAVGPLGRDAQADVDYKLNNDIYAYSRARGLYAGIAIKGSLLKVDQSANRTVYGPRTPALVLLTTPASTPPGNVVNFVTAINSRAP